MAAELDAGKASICFGGKALARKLSGSIAEGKAAGRLAAELAEKIHASSLQDPKLATELAKEEKQAQEARARGEASRRNGASVGTAVAGPSRGTRSASRNRHAKLDPERKALRIRLTDALAEKRMAVEAASPGLPCRK